MMRSCLTRATCHTAIMPAPPRRLSDDASSCSSATGTRVVASIVIKSSIEGIQSSALQVVHSQTHSLRMRALPGSDQTTASTIHQLRLGHGYFRSFLIRFPSYDSTQCQCSERVQNDKHLLLGCRLYQDERRHAGITRETTLHSLLFTPREVTALQDFIQRTGVATRQWLLQRTDEREGGDEWGWGRLREGPEEDSVER